MRTAMADEDMDDKHLLDSGLTCSYDGEAIEYTDLVMVVMMIKPHVVNNQIVYYDLRMEEDGDYLYEPVFFHGKNWDEIEEGLRNYLHGRLTLAVPNAILNCTYCGSGVLEGETTGVVLTGEIHRSQRNPDLEAYSNHFEPLNVAPVVICISCMRDLNTDVQELWEDGVCHDEECKEGTIARCWRSGCPGNCPNKTNEDEE